MVEQGSHNPRVGSSSLPAATSSTPAREFRFAAALERRVGRSLERACGVDPASPVVVALSGGRDSTALLSLVVASRAGSPGTGRVVAAHLNHRLRAAASDRDALFASAFARATGVPCVVGEPGTPLGDGGNLEAEARACRYGFLAEVSRALVGPVCVAHTRDDQAETVVMRLARGAGARALGAMSARRADGVVRPLLEVSRDELRRQALARGVVAVDDATNDDRTRFRSRVRHDVLPALSRALGVDATARLARLAEELRVESALAEIGVAAMLDALPDPGLLPIGLASLGESPGRIVHSWLVRRGVRPTRAQVSAVVACARSGRPSSRVDLAGGARVERRYGDLLLVTGAAVEPLPWAAIDLPVPGRVRAGERWWIESERLDGQGDRPAGVPGPLETVLDASQARFPLRVRPPRPGDRVRLSRGGRKISDLLVDAKVPRRERSEVPLVVDADDLVLWVPGVAAAVRGGRRSRGDLRLAAHPA